LGAEGRGGALTLFFTAVALGILAAGWVVVPLIVRRLALLNDPTPGSVIDAEARRRVALTSLKEVEYDRVSGKLDDEDYRRLRSQLEREALTAIAAAEAAPGVAAATSTLPSPEESRPIHHACGFLNPPGSRFCSGCGQRLS
jgi:hypothetical protein